MKSIKNIFPWWFKVGIKLVLARLPVPYALWKKLGLFEHGDMNKIELAWDTFLEHARVAGVLDEKEGCLKLKTQGGGFTVLELGPGDSLFTALIAKALGATRCWLVDAGFFATTSVPLYVRLAEYLQQQGKNISITAPNKNIEDILHSSQSEYLTDGVNSLATLPEESIDYCFSNAVLEHIPKEDFPALAAELFRIVKLTGVCIHRVDLRDHLGGGLNNLRFSNATWESALFRKSGFYTNRIRFGEMISIFESAGFDCQFPRITRWDAMPIQEEKLNEEFRKFPDDDLMVSVFDVVLRRKQ